MANLRANKITSTEVFETTGSVQFDGDGDYLSLADSNDWNYSTGDFTIEFWYYFNSLPDSDGQFFYSQRVDGANYNFIFATNTKWEFDSYESSSQGPKLTFTTTHNLSTWNHLAVTRSGNTFRLFVNGVESATQTNSDNLPDLSAALEIGRWSGGDYYVNGHISNFRIIKGQALYTKNFTLPTRELTVIPNTVLLACQSTTNAAREATGKTITVNGNAVANELTPGLLTDRVKSGGSSAISGSVEFDGTGDYLSIPSSSDFDFGSTNDFTIECWIYQQNRDPINYTSLFQTDGSNLGGLGLVISPGSSGILQIYRGGFVVSSTSSVPINGWVHIAATRNSGTTRLFINGVLDGSSAISYTPTFNDIRIGLNPSSGAEKFQGFISNLRIVKGTALYTSNFIPPTRELKRLPNTVLLCCKNSSDPTAEETGKTITGYGNATARNFSPQVGFDGSVTFDGVTKINTPNYFYLPTGNTEKREPNQVNSSYGTRGLTGGGYNGSVWTNNIQYITIATLGNAQDFGDLSSARTYISALASSTRAVFGTGESNNTLDYVTISSTGNASDFGDSTSGRRDSAGCSNSTRGLFGGGQGTNIIDYITIASTGNAQDFGDLTQGRYFLAACSSSIRGVFAGGDTGAPAAIKNINYVTISTTGNATTFGDLTVSRSTFQGCSNAIKGLFGGGYTIPASTNIVDYITISNTGSAYDFGDLITSRGLGASMSSSTRGIFAGWPNNSIEYISIISQGNALDFGDTISTAQGGCSNGHGGLG